MRKMRQDEIDLINRVRKRENPLTLAVKKLTLTTRMVGKVLNGPRPFGMSDAQVLNHSSDEIAEMVHNEPYHPEGPPVVSPRCQCTLVPEKELEGTLDQIKRMVDHLPETHFCEQTEGECGILMNLVISKWAREFLKQFIKEKEGE